MSRCIVLLLAGVLSMQFAVAQDQVPAPRSPSGYATLDSDEVHQAWAETYARSGDINHDRPISMALDPAGSAYIVSRSQVGEERRRGFGVMKVDRFGRKVWEDLLGRWHDDPCCVTLGADGALYVAGSPYTGSIDGRSAVHRNIFTARIHPASGRVIWEDSLDAMHGDDDAKAMALDGDGNVIVTGWSDGRESSWDFLTVKYTPEGRELWRRRYDGPPVVLPGYTASSADEPTSLSIDSAGNIYVAGTSGLDMAVVTYSPTGQQIGTIRHSVPEFVETRAVAMQLHPDGGLVLTGVVLVDRYGTDQDVLTVRYDAEGEVLWVQQWSGEEEHEARPIDLELNDRGEAYVLARSSGDTTGIDYVLLKYDGPGSLEWQRRFDSGSEDTYGARADDRPAGMALDRSGNVYITGVGRTSPWRNSGLWTIKVDEHGDVQWEMRSVPADREEQEAIAISLMPSGDVYVLGSAAASVAESYAYTRPVLIRYLQGEPDETPPPGSPEPAAHLFPQPARDLVKLEYTLPAPAFVQLYLFDVAGNQVGTFGEDDHDVGLHHMEFSVAHLAAGVYAYLLIAGTIRYTGSVVVSR